MIFVLDIIRLVYTDKTAKNAWISFDSGYFNLLRMHFLVKDVVDMCLLSKHDSWTNLQTDVKMDD